MGLSAWHPVVVHFPVALLIVAALLDLVGLAFKRPALREGASWLLGFGAAGALVAAFVTHAHLDADAAETARATLENHETFAYVTVGLALAAGAARIVWLRRAPASRAARAGAIGALVLAAAAVGATGWFGGRLTHGEGHDHGDAPSGGHEHDAPAPDHGGHDH